MKAMGATIRPPSGTLDCVKRGLLGRCPACGAGRIFTRFLRVAEQCPACGTELHHHRADDFPPYIVIFIVGHLVGYGIYAAETHLENLPYWVHAAVWLPLTIGLCLLLLQPVKGAVVGLQYGLGMHGFGGRPPFLPSRPEGQEAMRDGIAGGGVAGPPQRGRP